MFFSRSSIPRPTLKKGVLKDRSPLFFSFNRLMKPETCLLFDGVRVMRFSFFALMWKTCLEKLVRSMRVDCSHTVSPKKIYLVGGGYIWSLQKPDEQIITDWWTTNKLFKWRAGKAKGCNSLLYNFLLKMHWCVFELNGWMRKKNKLSNCRWMNHE